MIYGLTKNIDKSALVYHSKSGVTTLGSQARGKYLVQALPPVFTLQCLTGKVDKNDIARVIRSNIKFTSNSNIKYTHQVPNFYLSQWQPDMYFLRYLSGSDPSNSTVTPLSNTLVV